MSAQFSERFHQQLHWYGALPIERSGMTMIVQPESLALALPQKGTSMDSLFDENWVCCTSAGGGKNTCLMEAHRLKNWSRSCSPSQHVMPTVRGCLVSRHSFGPTNGTDHRKPNCKWFWIAKWLVESIMTSCRLNVTAGLLPCVVALIVILQVDDMMMLMVWRVRVVEDSKEMCP